MQKFLMSLLIAFTCFALMVGTADAKRFGGGSSFGKQRAIPNKQYQRTPEAPKPITPAPAGGNKWLGPLAGLAIGAGLMSMFSGGFGQGQGFGGILMVLLAAGVIMFLIGKLRKPAFATPVEATAYAKTTDVPIPPSGFGSSFNSTSETPLDFQADQFLREAKMSFIRLQAANDTKNLDDVREFCTPEVYAEVAMQMTERGDQPQKTEVKSINAELLEVHDDQVFRMVSVRFTGELSENNNPLESIDEVWFIQKHLHNEQAKWLLAGIKQM